jgi:hypothetical protein
VAGTTCPKCETPWAVVWVEAEPTDEQRESISRLAEETDRNAIVVVVDNFDDFEPEFTCRTVRIDDMPETMSFPATMPDPNAARNN